MPAPIKTQAERAHAVARAATDLATQLELGGGKYGYRANHRLLELCNTIIDLIDDGDAMAQRDSLMWELRCDEGGNPVRVEAA